MNQSMQNLYFIFDLLLWTDFHVHGVGVDCFASILSIKLRFCKPNRLSGTRHRLFYKQQMWVSELEKLHLGN